MVALVVYGVDEGREGVEQKKAQQWAATGESPSKWKSLHAETLAMRANPPKRARDETAEWAVGLELEYAAVAFAVPQ